MLNVPFLWISLYLQRPIYTMNYNNNYISIHINAL